MNYLLIGGHALSFYIAPRYTKDLDIWIESSKENARKVITVLKLFGAPLLDLVEEDFYTPGVIFQIGVEPNRIDILSAIDGIDFSDAWPNRMQTTIGTYPVNVISKADLIKNKRSTGRLRDLADVQDLERAK
ncbi:MAG: hypothetical protein ACKVQS_08925 [Fimbriimonadaceae bacterium]